MNKDKKFLIGDTKERIKNIKEVTFKTINLRVSKRSNLTDEDYLIIRDTSRILLDDIKTIFNNLKRIEKTEDECKDYLGFNVEESKTAIYSTRDILKGLREKNTAVDEPKIYKLLNNSIDNYTKALELIDNYLNPPQIYVDGDVNLGKINKRINELAEKNAKEYAYSKTETTTKDGVIANAIVGNVILESNFSVKNSKGESIITFTDEGMIFKVKSFEVADENKWEEIKKILNDNEISIDIDYNTSIKEIMYVVCDYWNKFNKKDKNKLIDLIFE